MAVTDAPILVLGGTGLLGAWLVPHLGALGPVTTVARRSGDVQLDIADEGQVRALLARVRPAVVVHVAGLTDVDACERSPQQADDVNHRSVAHVAAALDPTARLVYVSTDQVYGDEPGPHAEDHPGPVNRYGTSKRNGELAALTHPGALVLRTNFFGPSRTAGRQSLSDWMIDGLRNQVPLPLFTDSRFSPLHVDTISAVLAELVRTGASGTYNLGGRDGMTKLEFGLAIADHLGLATEHVRAVAGAGIPERARRPADVRLDVRLLEERLGRLLPSVTDEIARL